MPLALRHSVKNYMSYKGGALDFIEWLDVTTPLYISGDVTERKGNSQ